MFAPQQPSSQGYNGSYGPYSAGATSRPHVYPTAGRTSATQPVDRPAPNAPSAGQYSPPGGGTFENGGFAGPQGSQTPSGTPVSPNGLVTPAQPAPQQAAPPPQYHAGQLPTDQLPIYQAAQIGQFQNPLNQQVSNAHNDLMLQVLQNPQSLNPQVVSMMKEQQKEAALAMQQQQQQQLMQNAAGRGASNDGAVAAAMRRIGTGTQGNILDQYRNIDIQAANQGLQDRLNALGMADQYQSGVMGRGVSGYGAQLQGQQAQAQQGYLQHQSAADAVNYNLQRALAQEGLYQAEAQSGQNAWGMGNNFNEGARQFNLNYGLNTAQMQNQQQQQLMQFIQSILNRGY